MVGNGNQYAHSPVLLFVKVNKLECSQRVAAPLEAVFGFFSEAQNLARLTPPSMHFEILTPMPIVMKAGTLIDYRLRLLGVPVQWQTRIETYEPQQRRFVDTQLRGPYKTWRHTHTFLPEDDKTIVCDHIDYAMPFGLLGEVAHSVFAKAELRRLFAYRGETAQTIWPGSDAIQIAWGASQEDQT